MAARAPPTISAPAGLNLDRVIYLTVLNEFVPASLDLEFENLNLNRSNLHLFRFLYLKISN